MKLISAEATVSEVLHKFPELHEIGNVITIFKRATCPYVEPDELRPRQ